MQHSRNQGPTFWPSSVSRSSFGFEGSLINAKATDGSGSGGAAADCNGTGDGDDAAARTFTPEQPIADAAEVDSGLGFH